MRSTTKENIQKKKMTKKKKRRFSFFRLFIFLVVVFFILWLLGKIIGFIYDGYQMYTENYNLYTQRREELVQDQDSRFEAYTNILFIGVDEGVQREADTKAEKEADTIILMSTDNKTGNIRFISIPPNTAIYMQAERKILPIRSLYQKGGEVLLLQEISKELGIAIHHYITVDLDTIREGIDRIGGIDIYIEHQMDYEDPAANLTIHLAQGYKHLDGENALKYLRYRSDDLGDIGRVQRQQQFVKALFKEVLKPSNLTNLPWIVDILNHRLQTSFEVFDVPSLTMLLKKISTAEPVLMMLKGTETKEEPKLWQLDKNQITRDMEELFPMVTNE